MTNIQTAYSMQSSEIPCTIGFKILKIFNVALIWNYSKEKLYLKDQSSHSLLKAPIVVPLTTNPRMELSLWQKYGNNGNMETIWKQWHACTTVE